MTEINRDFTLAAFFNGQASNNELKEFADEDFDVTSSDTLFDKGGEFESFESKDPYVPTGDSKDDSEHDIALKNFIGKQVFPNDKLSDDKKAIIDLILEEAVENASESANLGDIAKSIIQVLERYDTEAEKEDNGDTINDSANLTKDNISYNELFNALNLDEKGNIATDIVVGAFTEILENNSITSPTDKEIDSMVNAIIGDSNDGISSDEFKKIAFFLEVIVPKDIFDDISTGSIKSTLDGDITTIDGDDYGTLKYTTTNDNDKVTLSDFKYTIDNTAGGNTPSTDGESTVTETQLLNEMADAYLEESLNDRSKLSIATYLGETALANSIEDGLSETDYTGLTDSFKTMLGADFDANMVNAIIQAAIENLGDDLAGKTMADLVTEIDNIIKGEDITTNGADYTGNITTDFGGVDELYDALKTSRSSSVVTEDDDPSTTITVTTNIDYELSTTALKNFLGDYLGDTVNEDYLDALINLAGGDKGDGYISADEFKAILKTIHTDLGTNNTLGLPEDLINDGNISPLEVGLDIETGETATEK